MQKRIPNFSHIFVSIISYSSAIIMPFEYISFACTIADLYEIKDEYCSSIILADSFLIANA